MTSAPDSPTSSTGRRPAHASRPSRTIGSAAALVVAITVALTGAWIVPTAVAGAQTDPTTPSPPPTTAAPAPTPPTVPVPTVPPGVDIPDPGVPPIVGPGSRIAVLAGDSMQRASAVLKQLRGSRDDLVAERAEKLTSIDTSQAEIVTTNQALDQARRARVARAVQIYRGSSDAERVFPPARSLEDDRAVKLITDADVQTRHQISDLEQHVRDLQAAITAAQARIAEIDDNTAQIDLQITSVQAKLAGVGAAGLQVPAEPGPDPIGDAARKVQVLLDAAPPTPDGPTSAAYRTARRTLAGLVAAKANGEKGKKINAGLLDEEWASVGRPTMRAMLFALSQVGKPYVYATNGPDTYDCSGLTIRAWAEAGLALPHFSGAQFALGQPILPLDLNPGDLLTYGFYGMDHVTMYVGQGLVVEAKGHAYGVVVDASDTVDNYAGASRVLPLDAVAQIPQP